jgi:hypothetical protein
VLFAPVGRWRGLLAIAHWSTKQPLFFILQV